MARADQVKALVRSYADGDEQRFRSVALQIAAHAARAGQTKFAEELKNLVSQTQVNQEQATFGRFAGPTPLAQPRGELSGVLSAAYPDTKLRELVQYDGLLSSLSRILNEQRQKARLEEYGFEPASKLLLEGPPGTGKSMTGAILAGELQLPLFTIQLDGLITKYLGETATKLRLVFDSIGSARGVYLFDELDAIATKRDSANEMGEMKRVVNSFLQFLESHRSDSIIAAATNHPQLLDNAIFRRFDVILHYDLPSPDAIVTVMRRRLMIMDVGSIDWQQIGEIAVGLSHAEVTLASEEAAKVTILDGKRRVQQETLLTAVRHRQSFHSR